MSNFEIIHDDFVQAARYYCSRADGSNKEAIISALKYKYESEEYLDPLVGLFAQNRVKHTSTQTDMVNVPLEPGENMWGGVARIIIQWLCHDNKCTPRKLFAHFNVLNIPIPQWLKDEPDLQDLDKVPPAGTRAVLVFKAMVQGYLNHGDD